MFSNTTDKEKLVHILQYYTSDTCSLEDIIIYYMNRYPSDFSLTRVYELLDRLNKDQLAPRMVKHENLKFIADERAGYIHKYLSGKMFNGEEEAKKYVDCQIDNAQVIIDACKGV